MFIVRPSHVNKQVRTDEKSCQSGAGLLILQMFEVFWRMEERIGQIICSSHDTVAYSGNSTFLGLEILYNLVSRMLLCLPVCDSVFFS